MMVKNKQRCRRINNINQIKYNMSLLTDNCYEVTNLIDLREVIESNVTVILGLTTCRTTDNEKIMIRKFLKRKSELFPMLTFVYMEVSDAILRGNVPGIIKKHKDMYPVVYHIRDGNQILVEIEKADYDAVYGSFNDVEGYYIREYREYQDLMRKKHNNQNTPNSDTELDDIPDNSSYIDQDQIDQINTQIPNNMNQIQTQDQVNPELEKRRTLEKLVLLNEKYDELKINLFNEIKQRKKSEAEKAAEKEKAKTQNKFIKQTKPKSK